MANGNSKGNSNHAPIMADLESKAAEFGKLAGQGTASIADFAWCAFDAAVQGVISAAKPDDKDAPDDAAKLYNAFSKARAIASGEAENASSLKAQVSKLRSVIKVGSRVDMRRSQGAAAIAWRKSFEAAWSDAGKPAVYNTLVKVAREQIKADTPLDQSAMADAIAGTGKAEKTPLEKLVALANQLRKLNDGTEQSDGIGSAAITAALETIDAECERLNMEEKAEEIEQERKAALENYSKAELEAKLAELNKAA